MLPKGCRAGAVCVRGVRFGDCISQYPDCTAWSTYASLFQLYSQGFLQWGRMERNEKKGGLKWKSGVAFFLKGAALAGGAMGVAELAGCSPAEDKSPNLIWDKEADLVVVGGGTGQAGAAFGAYLGMKATLLEKREMVGGAMAFSKST